MGNTKKPVDCRFSPSLLQERARLARLHGHRPPPDLFDYETLERLEIEYLPIESLRPNSWNPNRMTERDFELLLLSIEEDGFTQPVLIGKGNIIIDGEHRWRAAASLGFDEIPVVRSEMGEVQMRISTIRHNAARGSSVGDLEEAIYRELEALDGLEWGKHSLLMDDIRLEDFHVPNLSQGLNPPSLPPEETNDDDESGFVGEYPGSVPEFESFMTKRAQQLQHMREEMLPRAKTKEDRDKIQREMAIYRLSLAFSGDEAEELRSILEGNYAEEFLRLCRERLGGMNEPGERKKTGDCEKGRS